MVGRRESLTDISFTSVRSLYAVCMKPVTCAILGKTIFGRGRRILISEKVS